MLESNLWQLDVEKDEDLINRTATFLLVCDDPNFSVMPVNVKVDKKEGEKRLIGELLFGENIDLSMDQDVTKILNENEDAHIGACIVRENDKIYQILSVSETEEDAIHEVKYLLVKSYIEYKNITSKKQLEDFYKYMEEKVLGEFTKGFKDLTEEELMKFGRDALNGYAACPECGSALSKVAEAEDNGSYIHIFQCVEGRDAYIVLADELGTVMDEDTITEEKPKNSATKKKKKKN